MTKLTAGTVPNLVLAQRAIDKMAAAANHYLQDETGEAMIGIVVSGHHTNGVPTVYVLDTISPDESAEREVFAFKQGDERQFEIFTWMHENWQTSRVKAHDVGKQEAKWDSPLRHVGDWHKQPGFMVQPSGGDLASALDQLDDAENDMDFLLVPIVTLGHPPTTFDGAGVNYISVPMGDGSNMRVDWWYIHRDVRMFQPIVPVVYPDSQLPKIPPYPWHLKDEKRAEEEFALFHKNKMFYSIVLWDTDHVIPLEICIAVTRMGMSKVVILVTPWDYPEAPPKALIAPYIALEEDEDIYDVFAEWWEKAEEVIPNGWEWSPDKRLFDFMKAIEMHLGLDSAEPAPESSGEDQA